MRRRNFLQSLGAGLGLPLIAPMIEPRFAQRGDIVFASATGAAAAIRTKRISSLELTQLALERIDKFNPQLTAVVNLFREQALARAREADAALAAGTWWGPLHGVPITVKESFGIAGVPATAGAPFLRNNRPAEDANAPSLVREDSRAAGTRWAHAGIARHIAMPSPHAAHG